MYRFRQILVYRGVVQLFNAVAERQKELKNLLAANMTSKKRRLHGIYTENFNRRLTESKTVKVFNFKYFSAAVVFPVVKVEDMKFHTYCLLAKFSLDFH